MPYVSDKQRRFMHADPKLRPVARKWDKEEAMSKSLAELGEVSKALLPKYTTTLLHAGSKPGAWGTGGESAKYLTKRTPGAVGRLRKRPAVINVDSVPHGTTPNKQQLKGMKRNVKSDAKREKHLTNWDKRFGHLPGNSGVPQSQFTTF